MGVGSEIKERTEGALDKAEGALDDARPKADKRMEEGEDKADHMSKKVRGACMFLVFCLAAGGFTPT